MAESDPPLPPPPGVPQPGSQPEAAAADSDGGSPPDFLNGLGHSLRTPLSGILGMAELLLETELGPRQRQFAEAIQTSGLSLLDLTRDVLDLARIEGGGLEFVERSFDAEQLLVDASQAIRPRCEARGVELQVYCDPMPGRLRGDSVRLRRVVDHLLENALFFTHRGRIALAADAESAGGLTLLRVRVSDTGAGLSRQAAAHIFEPFAPVGSAGHGGGTGLGLAICQRTVTAMGGSMEVESREGRGSTFWFRVPMTVVDTAEPPPVPPAPKHGRSLAGIPRHEIRVLVVEDNAVNQLLAVHQLKFLGFGVEAVENGKLALQKLAGERFDLVLMDCQMPELDGWETTRRLRAASGPEHNVPVIAVTAHAIEGWREKCFAAGMDDYLPKPYREKDLLDAIERNLRR
ncbi:MAG: response regulator [Acidobacteriota bacterium]